MCSPMCRCFLGKYCDIPKKNTKFSERTPHFFYYFKVIFWLHECLRHKRANAAPKLCHVEADGAKSSATDRHIVVKKVSHVGCHVWPKECWARLRGCCCFVEGFAPIKIYPQGTAKNIQWHMENKGQGPKARGTAGSHWVIEGCLHQPSARKMGWWGPPSHGFIVCCLDTQIARRLLVEIV